MGCILNYLHAPIRRGIILAKSIIPLYSIEKRAALQSKRVLTTQRVSSSLSPLSLKYDFFFPSYYRQYEMDILDSNISDDKYTISNTNGTKKPNIYPMTCPGFEDKPNYIHLASHDSHNSEPIVIEQGQYFDVISLLSTHADDLVRIGTNNLVKANDLKGKYILLCCGFVPSMWIHACPWWDLSLLSSELSQPHINFKDNFEIVIVPKMRQKWDNDEDVFHDFFSAFPGCLTIPFTHKYRCDYICKSLNFEGKPICILVDPLQKVLQVDFEKTVDYGARGFPFTNEHLSLLDDEVEWSESCSPSIKSLAGLLGCESNPSSLLLHKFDSEETISIEQLNKHHVGLYIFMDGCLLKEVRNIHQQCRDQGLDLEIVLVCIPGCMDPKVYQDIVDCLLKKHQVSNWWVFPYNNSACLRLYQLLSVFRSYKDSLIIVGPNNKFVDRQADEVLVKFGPHLGLEAYPFTIEALFRAFLQRLDTVTLESFLTYDYVYRDYECVDSKIMPVSELKGKNVLVYVGSLFRECADVRHWYNVLKKWDPDFELVYVPVVYPPSESEYSKLASDTRELIFKSKTKWLICPFEDPKQSLFLKNHDAFLLSKDTHGAKKGLPIPSLLAFGKDGHLHSLDALRLFQKNWFDAYPFLPESNIQNLCQEIATALIYKFDLNDIYERELMNSFDFLKKHKTQN